MGDSNTQTKLKEELEDLLSSLHSLGKELPNCLYSLTQVVQPQIPSEVRVPLLGKMFATVPQFLATNASNLSQIVLYPPENEVAFRLLLDLRQVQQILHSISYLQLLHLTNNMIPPGSPQQQLAFLQKVQEIFQCWSYKTLQDYHNILSETPLHLERQRLLQLEPKFPIETLHLIIELLKLPLEELKPFKQWIEVLPQNQIILMVNLLQIEPAVLIEIKRRITTHLHAAPSVAVPISGEKRTRDGRLKSQSPSLYSDPTSINTGIAENSDLSLNSRIPQPMTKKQLINEQSYPVHQFGPPHEFPMNTPPPLDIGMEGMEIFGNLDDLDGVGDFDNFYDISLQAPAPSASAPNNDLNGKSGTTQHHHNHHNHDPPVQQQQHTQPSPPTTTFSATPIQEKVEAVPPSTPSHFPFQSPLPPQPQFQLRIAKQPPAKTVYQRILKPYPAVMLLATGSENEMNNSLFVEATLLRADSEVELPLCLDGNRIIRISTGVFASFKKLKILSTSQQQGTLFRLKFQLKRYVGNVFETVNVPHTISNPIEVFSHTQYLQERKNKPPPPPTITEILPAHGSVNGGTRVAILGNNFHNSNQLRVSFGDGNVVNATYWEGGTLLCNSPPMKGEKSVKIRVSNDGKDWCETFATFTYLLK